MVRASASQSIDLEFIFLVEFFKKMVFIFELLGAQYKRYRVVDNKPTRLLAGFLGKRLNGMPPSVCGTQVAEPRSLPVVVAQPN